MSDNQDLARICVEEHKMKTALREKEAGYYPRKMEELGLKSLERFLKYHPNPSKFMRLGITYAHRDIESVAEAMAENKPWAVVSGLNPSGPLHFGHKAVFDELLWLQQQGAEIFIPITNDESYVVDKSKSMAESRKIAYEHVIPTIIAMGFDSKKTHIFVDSDYPDIYNVAMDLSTKITLNKAFGVFGFKMEDNPGTLFYRSAVQLAQILLPQYEEFGGPKPTLIPVGIDQYPYIMLARDIAEKKGFIPPAGLFLKFLWGLDGKGKMSTSREGSSLFLTDSEDRAKKLLKSSYTGGSPIAKFQKEFGGIPEICPIYSLRTYHFEKDDKIKYECSLGEILCGECKNRGIESVVDYLRDHQEKLEEARGRIDEFILKTPIRSIL